MGGDSITGSLCSGDRRARNFEDMYQLWELEFESWFRRSLLLQRMWYLFGRDVTGARNNFFSEYGKAVLVGWDGNSA